MNMKNWKNDFMQKDLGSDTAGGLHRQCKSNTAICGEGVTAHRKKKVGFGEKMHSL